MSSDEECCVEPDALEMQQRLLILAMSFLGFCLFFVAAWILQMKYYRKFSLLTPAMKADNSSRANSTLHSIVVVPCLGIGILQMQWSPVDHFPQSSVAFLQGTLCFTLGYFACDTVLLLMYQIPQWPIFVVHHLIASCPYVIYMYVAPCPFGLYTLAYFMLVEFSNISLNAQVILEQTGRGKTIWYAIAFYTTFFGWIICRLINPVWQLVDLHRYIFATIPDSKKWCMYPGTVCAYFIALFCIVVFIVILCKDLRDRWKRSPSIHDVAENKAPITLDHKEDMTQDEVDLTLESPTRQLLYEAREKMHEIEEKIVDMEKEGRFSFPKLGGRGDEDAVRQRTRSSTEHLVHRSGEANE